MSLIDQSELDDFKQAIATSGLDADDFELIEHPHENRGAEIYAVTGEITIKRKSTGRQMSYNAGHGSTWPTDFGDDLSKGIFG